MTKTAQAGPWNIQSKFVSRIHVHSISSCLSVQGGRWKRTNGKVLENGQIIWAMCVTSTAGSEYKLESAEDFALTG